MPAFACALLLGISLQVAPLNVPASPVYALVGVDEDPGGPKFSDLRCNDVRRRSDSLVLVVPVRGAPARALWIPRDTLVHAPSGGQDIIGHALRRGGVGRLDAVLLADFGIHVSGHAVMDHGG